MQTEKLLLKIANEIKKSPCDVQAAEDYFEVVKIISQDDKEKALKHNKTILGLTAGQLREKHDIQTLDKFFNLRKKALLLDSFSCFDSYVQYLEWDRDSAKRFYLPRRKVLKPVVDELQRIDDGELDLLSISLPPGVGKTTLGIFFLTWIMGKYPSQPNLASAHSDKLTRSFYDGVLSIITDPEYLWADVFPAAQLEATNAKDETINLEKAKRFKTLTCRSIDGSLTGATRCERILYADDLVSGIEEAMSKPRMDTLWGKYTNDLKSRKKQGCKELHIATRWSVQDVIGRLERQYENDPRAKFITVPALNENDESNFNYTGGVGFDTKYFYDMRETLDNVSWRCLFQQEPIEREGIVFDAEKLNRYFELPPDKEPDAVIAACDTAESGADSVCMPVAYIYGDDIFIADVVFDNSPSAVTKPQCAKKLVEHKVSTATFESNSAGEYYAKDVDELVKKEGGRASIRTKRTISNKQTRIEFASDGIIKHFFFKHKSLYNKTDQYGMFMRELTSYTRTGKVKHDDAPDGLSLLENEIRNLTKSKIELFQRLF